MDSKKMLVDAYSFFDEESAELKKEIEVDDLLVDIACEFIKFRAARGLTQKELANKLQMTQAMVSKLESGEYNPTVKMLYEIARKLSWNFKLEFNSTTEQVKYEYCGKEQFEENREYIDNMGLAS